MIFSHDNESGDIIATIKNNGKEEIYECLLSACKNPVCTCGTIYLELVPEGLQNTKANSQNHRFIDIDLADRKLDNPTDREISDEDQLFSEKLINAMDEQDFDILQNYHLQYKNRLCENAGPDSFDVHFEFDQVEYDGLMYAYNDVLPYGDQLQIKFNEKKYMIYDQYCLLPKCSCTDTMLDIVRIKQNNSNDEILCSISLSYKKKKWEFNEESSLRIDSIKSAVEEQIPDIYKRMLQRHKKLKAVYKYNKSKYYSAKQYVQGSNVGRNDPCPCGSGKKYKKCCLK